MTPTKQPKWQLVANLGDASPVDYGGYFVYRDLTGEYTAEAEVLMSPDSDDAPEGWTVYRFILDRLKMVTSADGQNYLVPDAYDSTWPHPVHSYVEWFDDSLPAIAQSCSCSLEGLREDLCSSDPIVRAQAYRAIGDHHGYENLDSDPRTFHKRGEVSRRYGPALRGLQKREGKRV